jgi:hypothetical protein
MDSTMLFVNYNPTELGEITKWHKFKISTTTKNAIRGDRVTPHV